jgi:hypothetical protein
VNPVFTTDVSFVQPNRILFQPFTAKDNSHGKHAQNHRAENHKPLAQANLRVTNTKNFVAKNTSKTCKNERTVGRTVTSIYVVYWLKARLLNSLSMPYSRNKAIP